MSVIKCGFEIEIADDKAFIEKVAKYMETEPELVTYDNISNFIEDSIFNDFSYGSGEKSHQIRTDNQIADVARVRGIETDGGFYTSIDCDEIVEVVDKMYDEKQRGLTDGEFAKSVLMYAYGEFKSFYDSWVKNPEKYEPQTREVIGKLSDELAKLSVYDDLIIKNYDGQGAGNHRVGNFVEALEEIGTDFDVVEVKPKEPKNPYSCTEITVQTDDDKAFQRYDYEANRNAIKHDKYMGDGKYESIQTLSKKDVIKKDIEQQRLQKGKE